MGSIRKLSSKRYEARYRDPAGRSRSKSFATKAEARLFLADVDVRKSKGEWTNPRLGRELFGDYAKRWLETKSDVHRRTLANIDGRVRNHFLLSLDGKTPALGEIPVADIRPSDILTWRARMKAEHASDTVNASLGTLRQIFRAAVSDRLISRNPCDGIKSLPRTSLKEIHPLESHQIPLLADAIYPRFRCLIYTAAHTGLRAGELWALRVPRVNLLKRTLDDVVSVSEARGGLVTKPPKNGKGRMVTLPRFIAEMLAEHMIEYPSKDGFVFTSPKGFQVRHRNFMDDHFYPALDRVQGFPLGFRFHDLRHTHASIIIAQGWRPEQVKDRLGHGSIRTTYDWYGHLFENHDDALLEVLDTTIQEAERSQQVGCEVSAQQVGSSWDSGGTQVLKLDGQGLK
jgi:integrase